jgi:hypothetical protein
VVLRRSFTGTTPQYVSLVCIVPGAFLVIREYLVCGSNLSEEGSGALDVAIVAIGM